MKFTFKTIKPTERYKSFEQPYHEIKLNKFVVGSIDDNYPHKIRLMVLKDDLMEDGNPNCEWKWITLIHHSNSVKDAKEFLNNKCDRIIAKYNLYSLDKT